MEERDFKLDFDGNQVYITIKSNAGTGTRLFLVACNLILSSVLLISFLKGMPASMFGSAVLLLFLLQYTIWTFCGTEIVSINQTVITYRKQYLFYKTPLITKKTGRKINVISYDLYGYKEPKRLKVVLEGYNFKNVPENVYEFSLPVTSEQAEMISYIISLLYLNKISCNFELTKINLN